MTVLYIDADACPVKQEVFRIARRHGLRVLVVSNSRMGVPQDPEIQLVVVGGSGQLDAADDWIAERVGADDVVVTGDIPLAARCLARGAQVIPPTGRPFTADGIGEALAGRELMAQLREMGTMAGGPPPFAAQDRSRFLHALDEAIRLAKRGRPPAAAT